MDKQIPRMRTAAKIVAELKALDPGTSVTEYCIRQMIQRGDVPVVWAGNKALVDLNRVLEIFQIGTEQEIVETPPVPSAGIRRISV